MYLSVLAQKHTEVCQNTLTSLDEYPQKQLFMSLTAEKEIRAVSLYLIHAVSLKVTAILMIR